MAVCQATKQNGTPCPNKAGIGSSYCFTHDPDRAGDRKAARSKGGAARHGRVLGSASTVEHVSVKTTADIVTLLERAINDCFGMENSLNRARTIGYLASAACKALELDQLADRVAALENTLKARDAK